MRYGFFDDNAREYVIERPDIPVSWTNYLGVEELCSVISHNAGGYSFYRSAQQGRITRFRPNGVPLDRPGYYVYLRDDETSEFWSVSWQPVGKDLSTARYQCRHGLSYSRFSCDTNGILAEQTLFVPRGDAVQLWDVVIANTTDRPRRISLFGYLEFSLRLVTLDNQDFQMGLYASGSSYQDGIIDYDFFYAPGWHCFFAADFQPDSYDCVRDTFLGEYRSETNPLAVARGHGSDSSQRGGNHCAALHKRYVIAPRQRVRAELMLGMGAAATEGRRIREKYSDHRQVDRALADLRDYWDRKLATLQCATPDRGIRRMVNGWTPYQAETCVTWSRFASFVEVGGRTGLGFRDTAQDAMSVPHSNPQRVRQRIVELLHAQTSAGFALHLFDPRELLPKSEDTGLDATIPTIGTADERPDQVQIPPLTDVCSDDALWLIGAVCDDLQETGATEFLETVIPFADGGEASVYAHLKRALDFSAAQRGPHGLCLGLRADWNDCINLRGGESAFVSFLFHWALRRFVDLARSVGRDDDVVAYGKLADQIRAACDAHLWDGHWYLRGYTAAGRKIGTQEDREGRLFLTAQTWAVMSGVSRGDRAAACMDAVDEHLFSRFGLHLLWPAYSQGDDDIGFVTRVYKGIKENAAIFSHPNPWAVIAECMLGRGNRAMKFYRAMLPCEQNDMIEIRQAEPYSYCQFVIGRDHPLHGQARHPWLTGSAAWFYIAATRWILGVRPGHDGLTIDPCIPPTWQEFSIRRQWRGGTYAIDVRNPKGVASGVAAIELDGRPVTGPLPPPQPGAVHKVSVVMG